MQRAMATEAEASREARAKVIAAEGDQKASIALKEAADMINQSPVALQLRYLQTLGSIAAEKNSTIVFPIPMEMLRHFSMGKWFRRENAINIRKEGGWKDKSWEKKSQLILIIFKKMPLFILMISLTLHGESDDLI